MNAPETDLLKPLLDAQTIEKLGVYVAELLRWNKKISLTSVPDNKVFVDLAAPSAWLGAQYSKEKIGVIADFGTGPGFPGIPMAIADPNNRYLLIDSIGKKTGFIKHCIRLLELKNAEVLETRMTEKTKMEPVDRIVSRAAGEIGEILRLFKGKAKSGAIADFFKGNDAEEEIEKARKENPAIKAQIIKTPDWFGGLRIVRINGAFSR